MSETSTKPYLLRAIYEWCTDNGYTPHIAAVVDGATKVPTEFIKNGEIVLNISFSATSGLKMDNDVIRFSARFGGVARELSIPVDNVVAIYARENGQGMAFEATNTESDASSRAEPSDAPESEAVTTTAPTLTAVPSGQNHQAKVAGEGGDEPPEPPRKGGRPTLTRIK